MAARPWTTRAAPSARRAPVAAVAAAAGLALALTACGPEQVTPTQAGSGSTVTVAPPGGATAPGSPTSGPGSPTLTGTATGTSTVPTLPTTAPSAGATTGPTTTPTGSATTPAKPAEHDLLRPGDEGPRVLTLQRRLVELGYWLGTPDGNFGFLTTQAVYALQGAAGLGRDGVVGPATLRALSAGAVPRVHSSGNAVEIDISAGTIAFVSGGRPWRVLHTSTGNERPYASGEQQAIAHTPRGVFSVQRRIDGVRVAPLGRLYRPVYFYGGYAVHGSGSIPAYPASHGCARVSNAAIDMIWRENLMPNGLRVLVRD
jgi:peptidoglycan hydrolase-like protein with peptidoglycan-binding domain